MLHPVEDLSGPEKVGLPMNDKHRVLQWDKDPVYISYTRKGDAIAMHIAADKKSKRHLRKAANFFCDAVFEDFDWCKMVIGVVVGKSILNLAKKCNFELEATGEKDGEPVYLVARKR